MKYLVGWTAGIAIALFGLWSTAQLSNDDAEGPGMCRVGQEQTEICSCGQEVIQVCNGEETWEYPNGTCVERCEQLSVLLTHP